MSCMIQFILVLSVNVNFTLLTIEQFTRAELTNVHLETDLIRKQFFSLHGAFEGTDLFEISSPYTFFFIMLPSSLIREHSVAAFKL